MERPLCPMQECGGDRLCACVCAGWLGQSATGRLHGEKGRSPLLAEELDLIFWVAGMRSIS